MDKAHVLIRATVTLSDRFARHGDSRSRIESTIAVALQRSSLDVADVDEVRVIDVVAAPGAEDLAPDGSALVVAPAAGGF